MREKYSNKLLSISGLNLYVNPLSKADGELIRSVNVKSEPFGAKRKRRGYSKYLGTPDASQVNTLFTWQKDDGTTIYNYRASGSALYYSAQGTGDWTLAVNGTITNDAHVGQAVLDDTLIVCDGAGATRHTTSGTSFTNTSLAPVAVDLEEYQGRIYAAGTASDLFYSTTNDATNWETTGTSDSSSFKVPDAGKLSRIFKSNDRLIACKNSGKIFKWDGYYLIDTASNLGPSSPYSVAETEGYFFGMNRKGFFGGYGSNKPQLLSNALQSQIYNDAGNGIVGTVFNNAPAETFRYDYLCSVGSVTDDLTDKTVSNCIMKYNYQQNEWLNYSFAHRPTAFNSYVDADGDEQLIFGDSSGQCYKLDTSYTDDGEPIEAVMEFVIHMGNPQYSKEWQNLYAFFNPGNQCKIQVAYADTFTKERKQWFEVGDCSDGVAEFRLPAPARSKLLFIKVYERSKDAPFTFYGFSVDADTIMN
jgi:hypothetical protein